MSKKRIFNRKGFCVFCGKAYTKKCEAQKFCCVKCRLKWHHQDALKSTCKLNYIKCSWCEKTFISGKRHAKFCSRACWYKAHYEEKKKVLKHKKVTRNCLHCGDKYQRRYGDNKGWNGYYCSEKCQLLARRAIKKKYKDKTSPKFERNGICKICGKHYYRRSQQQEVCSKSCGKRWYHKKTYESAGPYTKTCKICGCEFKSESKAWVLCSKTCRNKKNELYQKWHRDNLHDKYIVDVLNNYIKRKYKIKRSRMDGISKEIIKLKRESISIKRGDKFLSEAINNLMQGGNKNEHS